LELENILSKSIEGLEKLSDGSEKVSDGRLKSSEGEPKSSEGTLKSAEGALKSSESEVNSDPFVFSAQLKLTFTSTTKIITTNILFISVFYHKKAKFE